MHDPMPVLIVGDPNDLYAPLQPGDPLLDIADNTLIVVGAPCLRQGWRGGVGGRGWSEIDGDGDEGSIIIEHIGRILDPPWAEAEGASA